MLESQATESTIDQTVKPTNPVRVRPAGSKNKVKMATVKPATEIFTEEGGVVGGRQENANVIDKGEKVQMMNIGDKSLNSNSHNDTTGDQVREKYGDQTKMQFSMKKIKSGKENCEPTLDEAITCDSSLDDEIPMPETFRETMNMKEHED